MATATGQTGGRRRGRAKQQQADNAGTPAGSQGATGGTPGKRKIAIETLAIPPRGGRMLAEELWPFGELTPATKKPNGDIEGPSFFIPQDDNPDAALASARKRHKGVSFISRKMVGKNEADQDVDGVRIWRSPAA